MYFYLNDILLIFKLTIYLVRDTIVKMSIYAFEQKNIPTDTVSYIVFKEVMNNGISS